MQLKLSEIKDRRPTPERIEAVCEALAAGKGLEDAARCAGVHPKLVWAWRDASDDIEQRIIRALTQGFEHLADTLLTIPEDIPDVARARLKSDNIKWLLSKRAARMYGDKLDINVTQTVSLTSALDDARARVQLVDRVDTANSERHQVPLAPRAFRNALAPIAPAFTDCPADGAPPIAAILSGTE